MTTRFLMFMLLISTPALGDEMARLRYATILKIVNMRLSDIEGVGATSIGLSARSKRPEIGINDITLTLEPKSGPIPLALNKDGAFELPVSDDLVAEDPWIVTNQPKGTMVMTFRVRGNLLAVSPKFTNGRPSAEYRQFFAADDFNKKVDSVAAGIVGQSKEVLAVTTHSRRPEAVYFEYKGDELPHAVMIIDGKEQRIKSTAKNRFVLPYEPKLADPNPQIVLEPVEGWSWFAEFAPLAEKRRSAGEDE